MNRTQTTTPFEPHLVINDLTLPKSREWTPRSNAWCLLQIKSGVGYWRQPHDVRELPPGSALVFAGEAPGNLIASQLSEVVAAYFCLDPERLIGLLSLNELNSLKRAMSRGTPLTRMLPPENPVSERFKNLCRNPGDASLPARLQLLELFFELFPFDDVAEPVGNAPEMSGRERLRHELAQMAATDILGMSMPALAVRLSCSTRHLSRLFHEEMGVSFREKQTEIRLAKARQMLLSSNAKLVEVALNCGYHSYSLFGSLFRKRFGMSPAKWRQNHRNPVSRRQKPLRLQPQ